MKIALINENSQAAKNGIIEAALRQIIRHLISILCSLHRCKLSMI